MNIYDVLKIKYPEADFRKGIIIFDDGQGPYIKEWNLPDLIQPSMQEIEDWKTDPLVLEAFNKKANDLLNAPIYAELDALDLKSIRAIRGGDSIYIASLEGQAQALRDKLIK